MEKYTCPLCQTFIDDFIKINKILSCKCKNSMKTNKDNIYLCKRYNNPAYIILYLKENKTSFEYNYDIILTLDFLLSPQEIANFDFNQIKSFI